MTIENKIIIMEILQEAEYLKKPNESYVWQVIEVASRNKTTYIRNHKIYKKTKNKQWM
jgi:hypothetical protein